MRSGAAARQRARHGPGCARSARRAARRRWLPLGQLERLARRRAPRAARRSSAPDDLFMPAALQTAGSVPRRRARMAWPGGLSTTPSPHTAEVSTPELWFGNSSSPPSALRRTRRNSRRLSGRGQSKSARTDSACGAGGDAPCRRSSTGRTASRKVTKLDTGLPGRPMNQAVRAVAAAHLAEGERLAGLDRDLPEVEPALGLHRRAQVVFLADRHAARGDDQVVALRRLGAARRAWRRAGRARCPGRCTRSPAPASGRAACSGWSCRSRRACSGSPGITSSSPVENSATRGRRDTVSVAAPTEAARPERLRREPRAGAAAPRRRAARPRRGGGSTGPARGTTFDAHRRPSTASHCSCITTASAPAGTCAPVKMRAAVPGCKRLADHAGRDALAHRQHARPAAGTSAQRSA